MAGAMKMRKTARQQGGRNNLSPSNQEGQSSGNEQASSSFLSDQEMLWDIINTEKHLAHMYNVAALEAGQVTLYQDLMVCLNETQASQRELFHIMLQQGWYHLHPADSWQLQQVYQQFQGMMEQLSSPSSSGSESSGGGSNSGGTNNGGASAGSNS
ncbi:spore coat protein [Heliobacterium chlorum]|uniref:Spore coat protein n=1 Tax=Heliobacterium chlorum TaxID=2698 RepID=A0ABR7T376_HELCL|nr:spore coat protein [Heliobacterium chlorum]MBC9785224.1 spore coat protein [Heliobacterium chlorum]